ncbi:MAG TPA: fatty acid--CoA ligase family protein [Novosphingobium sp.]|nr:fatty acid--CoA ligase family protein [Novosphingobium sp.]
MIGEIVDDAETFLNRLKMFLTSPPSGNFVEFEGRWWTGSEVAEAGLNLDKLLQEAGVPHDVAIGVVVRNRIGHACALWGLVGSGRSVVSLSSLQPDKMIVQDVENMRLGVVVAEESDWTEALRATLSAGRIGVVINQGGITSRLMEPAALTLEDPLRRDTMSVTILTSGTTGVPKRFELGPGTLMKGKPMISNADPTITGNQIEVHIHHFSSVGGILQMLAYAAYRLPFCLLEKFEPHSWVAAVDRHGTRMLGIVPPIVRALLAADLPPDALKSVELFYGGGGALEPETIARCEERFGLRVCWGYGATEFGGTVATWTRKTKDQFGDKPGSCGIAQPGFKTRIVDINTGEPLPAGEEGRLEVLASGISNEWIVTNDLAKMDDDGFLYILGRLDGAINRGGYKVLPEVVASALRRHPDVAEAVVFGIPDPRLGEIPVAAVELRESAKPVTGDELRAFSRDHLIATSVPAEVRVYPRLPRSLTLKVDIPKLRSEWASGFAQAN